MSRPVMKRETIEESAIRLFATKGLARTTIKDIAAAAGVTEGALYRYYSGKEEMAWKLFNRELDEFTRLVSEVLFDERMPFNLRLGLAIKTIYDHYKYNGDRFAFILLTQHGFPEDKLLSRDTEPMAMAERFVGQAMGAGEIPPCDADLYAALLMGAIMQPLVLHRYNKLEITAQTHAQVTASCLRMLGLC
ncbi:MAG: TetR/AcrR family transcriptional regulator [Desulfomicrobium sp.]|nr:TetR/AcrR family transcriptional regulator [Pseudomonadota bacterium]MBV1713360.1 TetR/AcrR family transcriptional regulator [Desulfomicrobium sp.]MBU4570506.1 TetR/AcrR family transcriptional regulator [Pseudomonadota bacterium]MBU4593863.1 TetR/AcrR family transcriptional regulator [Pseudomonadota bacterium]MBV1719683.1 TetR/AcrR family transcriptional regulator [Desulfomicrobium sp.]